VHQFLVTADMFVEREQGKHATMKTLYKPQDLTSVKFATPPPCSRITELSPLGKLATSGM
jgi:hypothetical protein